MMLPPKPKDDTTVADVLLLAALVVITYAVSAYDAIARRIRRYRS